MNAAPDFAGHMEAVARHLLGEPNRQLSKPGELRFGAHGSLAIDLEKGTYYDHEHNIGGGVLALITAKTGRGNVNAIKWLRDEFGVKLESDNTNGQAWPVAPVAKRVARPKIVDTYDYTDESGELLFQVVRFEPKDFRQRAPDGADGWTWTVKGVRKVLYNLQAVLEGGGRTIFIAEGEKDVDALTDLGLIGTTCPGGAGKWDPEFSMFFTGADCVIFADNDLAGRAHAEAVARSLALVAQEVRILELPGLPPKGDVSDWIAAGGTVEALDVLAKATPVWDDYEDPLEGLGDGPQEQGQTTGLCLSLDQWATRDVPKPDFLLGAVFSTTSRAMISAETGIGKTHFGFAIGFAMAAGLNFCHWQGKRKARVLIVDGEMSIGLVKERLDDEAARSGHRPEGLFVLCKEDAPDMSPLDTPEGQMWLDALIKNLGGVDFVILDNVMALVAGDLKEEEAWKPVIAWMLSFTKRRIGILWVHHTGLDTTRSYGTSTRTWQLDTSIIAERGQDTSADITMRLTFPKCRQRRPENRADFDPVILTLKDGHWSSEGSQVQRKTNQTGRALDLLKQAISECGMSIPGMPSDMRGVKQETWKSYCDIHDLSEADEPESRARIFRKVVEALKNRRRIASKARIVWIIK